VVAHWRRGGAEALLVEGKKRVNVGRAHGGQIPGAWLKADGAIGGAIAWRLNDADRLVTLDLHDPKRFEWTFAASAGGGALAGYGQHKVHKSKPSRQRALFWRADGMLVELKAPDGTDAVANATDGSAIVGRIGQRAALWHAEGAGPVMLSTNGMCEARGVSDGEHVGSSWQGRGSRAALWRGTEESFVDLTPRKHQSAAATDCAGGLQVGYCSVKDETRNGSSSMATRAALWAGNAVSHVDLQAFLPEPWNASAAWAIEIQDGLVRIAGAATRFGVSDELTPRENHYLLGEMAVVWEARLP
jgi:hypothetical protein